MNATSADQRRLLDLAELDARLERADSARRNPPQAARVQELLAQRQVLSQELAARMDARDDLQAELGRLEADVAVVQARTARDTDLLAGTSSAKDAQGLERELSSLAQRRSDLEDAELAVMERLEAAEKAVSEQEALIDAANEEGARLSAEGKSAVAEAGAQFDSATRDRAAVAEAVPEALLALYDRLAQRSSGAALLRRQTCEGCHMVLSGTDLQAVRTADPDAVVMCPECGCILVRTEESGL